MIKQTIKEEFNYQYFCDKCKKEVYPVEIQKIDGKDICDKCIEYPTKWSIVNHANKIIKKDNKYYATFERQDYYKAYPTTKLVEIPNPNN